MQWRRGAAVLWALAAVSAQAAVPHAVAPADAEAARFRVALGEANGRPSVLYDAAGTLRGGLGKDIADALGSELGLTVDHVNLPRARQEAALERGDVEAACFLAPAWVAAPDRLAWSPPLFHIRQVVVSPARATPVTGPGALHGRRVGVLLNFVYPELQPLFASGVVLRDDAPSLDLNLQKLRRGRIDVLVDIDLAVLYRMAQRQIPFPVRIDPLWAAPNPVHCAFNRHFAERTPQLAQALAKLRDSGRIDAWLRAYTGGVAVPLSRASSAKATQTGGTTAQSVPMPSVPLPAESIADEPAAR